MFCENCGAKIADNDMFCQNCGKRIEIPTAQTQAEPVPVTQQAAASAAESQEAAAPQQGIAQQEQPVNPYVQQPQQNPYAQQNSYLPQNPYAAPNGQQQLTPQPKKSSFKITKKMVIIGSIIAAVVIAAIIVICVLVSNANNPVNKMVDAINSGDYEAAEEIYYDNLGSLMDNETVIEAIQKQVDAVEADYKNGVIDYDTAIDKLNDIYDLPMAYETTISDVKSNMYALKRSAENLEEGNKYLEEENYSSAIYYYDKVSEDDTANYNTAQSQRAKAVDGIRQSYIDKAKEKAEKGSYDYAISYLQDGLENDYLENDEKLTKQIDAYVDEVIKKSGEYMTAKNYEEAEDILSDTMYVFNSSTDNYKKLETQLTKVESETPTTLHDMDINNSDYFYRYQNGSKDVLGNVYDSGNVCTMSVSKYYSETGAYAEMYVKDYKKVKGTLAIKQTSSSSTNKTAYVEIVDDKNNVLYKSETLTSKSKPIEFELNITDAEWLTIKFVSVDNKVSGTMNLILADVEFYKIGSSEPDAPAAETSKLETSAAESSKEESSKAESSKEESSKAESSKTESSKAESSKAESSKAESSKAA